MADSMEDEEKMGSDNDLVKSKEEQNSEKPSDKDLIKAYLEDIEENKREE